MRLALGTPQATKLGWKERGSREWSFARPGITHCSWHNDWRETLSNRCSRTATPAGMLARQPQQLPRPAHLTRFVASVPRSDHLYNRTVHPPAEQTNSIHLPQATATAAATSRVWDNNSLQMRQVHSQSRHREPHSNPARQATSDSFWTHHTKHAAKRNCWRICQLNGSYRARKAFLLLL